MAPMIIHVAIYSDGSLIVTDENYGIPKVKSGAKAFGDIFNKGVGMNGINVISFYVLFLGCTILLH